MFLTAVACVLRNNGVEFYCERSAWWCHLATWRLVNDCVWNVDTEEPTAPTPRNSSILHVMPCSLEMFVSSVINMTDHPSFFFLANCLSVLIRGIAGTAGVASPFRLTPGGIQRLPSTWGACWTVWGGNPEKSGVWTSPPLTTSLAFNESLITPETSSLET